MDKSPAPGAIFASRLEPSRHPVLTSAASVAEMVPARLHIKARAKGRNCITDLLERDIHDLLTIVDRRLQWVLTLEAGTKLELHDVCQMVALAKTLRESGGGLTVRGLELSSVPPSVRSRVTALLGPKADEPH